MADTQTKRRRLLDSVRSSTGAPAAQELSPSEQQAAAEDEADADLPLPSDVEASFLFLRNEVLKSSRPMSSSPSFPGSIKGSSSGTPLPPMVLVTQLQNVLRDKRGIERELDNLRRRNVIRMFKLATGVDEHGVLLTSDYLQTVRDAAAAAAARQQQQHQQQDNEPGVTHHTSQPGADTPTQEQAMAEAFCTRVVPYHTDVSIAQSHLLTLLRTQLNQPPTTNSQGRAGNGATAAGARTGAASAAGKGQAAAAAGSTSAQAIPTSAGLVSADDALARLLQLGVLARHPVDDGSYLLCCPGLGPIIKSILAGRKELLAFIAKKPRGEVAERTLIGSGAPAAGKAGSSSSSSSSRRRAAEPPAASEGGFLRPLVIDVPVGGNQGSDSGGQSRTKSGAGGLQARAPALGTPGLKLRQSVMSVGYHLRDLLGRGDVVRVHSTAGDLIKIAKPG